MSKEKVFIVVSHKHSLKNKRSKSENPNDWEVTETVEFVSELRRRHYSMSSAIGDYINRKMVTGTHYGITDYEAFEAFIRKKYYKELKELDALYRNDRVKDEQMESSQEVITDQFGNVRVKTVFDLV